MALNIRKPDMPEAQRKTVTRQISYQRWRKGREIPPCEICGSTEDVEMHHEDYLDPDLIYWLCRKHHGQITSALGLSPVNALADGKAALKRMEARRLKQP